MPYIELKTNISLDEKLKNDLKEKLGKDITLLNKTESWLMLNFIDNQSMYFKGSNAPCVILEVKLYGAINERLANSFTSSVTATISSLLNIKEDRIYFNYFGTNSWGYSGENF